MLPVATLGLHLNQSENTQTRRAFMLNMASLLRSSWIQVFLSTQRSRTQLRVSTDTAADKISLLLSMTDFEFMTPH